MVKRPYPPGEKSKKVSHKMSEYKRQLLAVQGLKNWYNLTETQFKNYVKGVLKGRGRGEDARVLLIRRLELRLDNVIFRLGFCSSRKQSRQLVNHGHFLVNNRRVDIPSYQVKKGDTLYSVLNESEFKKLENNRKYLNSDELATLQEILEIMRRKNPLWGI